MKIGLVQFPMPEQRGNDVEDELHSVDVEEEGRHAVKGTVLEKLHPNLHFGPYGYYNDEY